MSKRKIGSNEPFTLQPVHGKAIKSPVKTVRKPSSVRDSPVARKLSQRANESPRSIRSTGNSNTSSVHVAPSPGSHRTIPKSGPLAVLMQKQQLPKASSKSSNRRVVIAPSEQVLVPVVEKMKTVCAKAESKTPLSGKKRAAAVPTKKVTPCSTRNGTYAWEDEESDDDRSFLYKTAFVDPMPESDDDDDDDSPQFNRFATRSGKVRKT